MIDYQDTSRAAWIEWNSNIDDVSGKLDRAILRVILAHQATGIICEHIEDILHAKHQSVSGNIRHLYERGFVMDSGNRGVTRSGREAVMWICTLAPREQLQFFRRGQRGQTDEQRPSAL